MTVISIQKGTFNVLFVAEQGFREIRRTDFVPKTESIRDLQHHDGQIVQKSNHRVEADDLMECLEL